jgi:Restriction endonuclease
VLLFCDVGCGCNFHCPSSKKRPFLFQAASNQPFTPWIGAKLRVSSREEQLPEPGSTEARILDGIVQFYHLHRARFEGLADTVAERVLKGSGADYVSGWITPRSGDGGADFIGRLDVGSGFARTRLVVLGQAKCEQSTTPTGGNHIARTVARLRRGWLGVYVTTSYFSAPVQREVIDDQYPIVLIHGRRLAEEVAKMMFAQGQSLEGYLAAIDATYADRVMMRRPEEILSDI